MWSKFTQILFSAPLCLACQCHPAQNQGFCSGCHRDLPLIRHGCLRCGLPVSAAQQCACKAEDWPFSACVAASVYAFPVDALISRFKDQHRLSHGRSLGQLLAAQVRHQRLPLPDVLIPVPAHPERLQQRGFNPAVELARELGRALDIPVDCSSVRRTGLSGVQKRLGRRQRSLNVESAFELVSALPARRIALVDDVITTGATTKALAYLLRERGASDIQAWAVARTP